MRGSLAAALAACACAAMVACGQPRTRPVVDGSATSAPAANSGAGEVPAPPSPQPGPLLGDEDGTQNVADAGDPQSTPPAPPRRCAPDAHGPFWIVEGNKLEATIGCSTGLSDAAVSFAISPRPAGLVLDAQRGTLTWTPGLDQAGVYTFTLTETSTGDTGTLKVGVADAFDRKGDTPVDPQTYTEEYGVPVMHLSFDGKLSSSQQRPAKLVYRGHTYEILAKYRGATSLDFPKRSYTFEFPNTDEFQDPEEGFGHRDKLALVTTFNDDSYVRVPLAFDLWRRMDPGDIALKTFPVVLFVNGKYWGLYTAIEHLDSDLMKRNGLPKDGELFKAWHNDANFKLLADDGQPKSWLGQGYLKKAGEPQPGQPGAYRSIEDLTEFVATASDRDFQAHAFSTWLNQRDYENWWIFVTLILATDSGGKNAYHYRAPGGGPFRYVPWDLDATFGQDWDTRRTSPFWRYDFADKNELFQRMLGMKAIAGPMRARYQQLLDGPLKKADVLAEYDALQARVHDVALRDERRWGDEYRAFTRWADRTDLLGYEDEAAYVRKWIERRWDSLKNDGVP